MYSIYLLLCVSAVPKHGGNLETQIKAQHVLETSLKTHCFKNNNNNSFYSDTCGINFKLYCIVQATLLYIEGATLCGTLYSLHYIITVEVSVVVLF